MCKSRININIETFFLYGLFLLSLGVLLWQIEEWLFYPIDKDFPYSLYLPFLVASLITQGFLWRGTTKQNAHDASAKLAPFHRNRVVTASLLGISGISAIGLGIDAHWRVARIATIRTISVSPVFLNATIAMEDSHFYQHYGFDWVAIHRAIRADVQAGKIKQGGSTVSQQLAKNLFLTNDRSLWRKIREAFLTVALEQRFTKNQILTLYIQSIDYGLGQKGIKSASAYYFHTSPEKLTISQSAILVGLVPNPPQTWLSQEQLESARQIAIDRITFFFPEEFSSEDIAEARSQPLESLVYPYLSPAQRGATKTIPATLGGVSLYFFQAPETPLPVRNANPRLVNCLTAFLKEARTQFGMVGLDHVGLYADRPVRGLETVPSAHAFGQAIDISGFRFQDGSRLLVKDHTNPQIASRLLALRQLLQKHFDRVLHWGNEPRRHSDHFHAEVQAPRPLYHIRERNADHEKP